jgi:hypothetical protein
MNAWEREALENGGVIKRSWGFSSKEDAVRERSIAKNKLEVMHKTLEGCDWCCGGGDDEAEFLYSVIKKADEFLMSKTMEGIKENAKHQRT